MEQREEFAGTFYNNLRTLITLVDHLRDAGLDKYIKLPRISVVGLQSAGKSSVLESIVGLNFLPRGEGICTRRPLELRLVHVTERLQPWAMFEGSQKKLIDFAEVRRTIESLTDQVAGRNKGIVDDPIILTIYSNACPDLTLIDLPGITRIPLAGSDHPQDIERVTKEMAYRYISDPRTIVLCVCGANTDIATSEALMMARKVDKAGIRTLGVITKIDIMDRGTNARRVLLGQEVPLRLGYVGVKNRSQQDINDDMNVEMALQEELEFFAKHEVYSTMPPGYLGTTVLTQKLTQTLFTHIKHYLPEILRETVFRLKECEEKLRELGPSTPIDEKSKMQLLWNMVTDFCEIYKSTIRGKYERRSATRVTKDLVGGANIKQHFNGLLEKISKTEANSEYSLEDIERAMVMHGGDTIPGFPSVDMFLFLLQPQLEKLRDPVLDCLMDVHSYLEQLAHMIIERIFYRFPSLASEISRLTSDVLLQEREECRLIVENIIDAEETYIFTNDCGYLTQRTAIIPQNDRKEPSETLFLREIANRIGAYFQIVVRNVRDTIPKIIGTFLVRSSMEKLHLCIYQHINSNEKILTHLSEPAHITAEREMLRKQLETLRKAEKLMKHDPHLANEADNITEEIKKQETEQENLQAEKKRKNEQKENPRKPPEEEKDQHAEMLRSQAKAEKKLPTTTSGASLFGDGAKKPDKKLEKSLF